MIDNTHKTQDIKHKGLKIMNKEQEQTETETQTETQEQNASETAAIESNKKGIVTNVDIVFEIETN